MNRTPFLWTPILCAFAACSLSGARQGPVHASDATFSGARDLNRAPLFQITKNENANYVVYDLLVDGAGRLARDPLDVYWIMDARDGRREELNNYEQGVYGVTIEELEPEAGLLGFKINAIESKRFDIEVPFWEGEVETYTTIDGQRARITDIHLFVLKSWNPFSPNVEIRLAGLTAGGDEPVTVTEFIKN